MNLPPIKLPELQLPFDIPTLLHPPIDHFAMALPVVVLIVEVYNLFVKRRSIGVLSFMLLLFSAVAMVAAYQSGAVDAKAIFEGLSPQAQEVLKEHKTLGAYLVILVGLALVLKLLTLFGNAVFKIFYLGVLGLLIAGLYEQGQEGGRLVYLHGAHVEAVKQLDDKVFDLEEKIDDLTQKLSQAPTPQSVAPNPSKKQLQTQAPKDQDANATHTQNAPVEQIKQEATQMIQELQHKTQQMMQSAQEYMQKAAQPPAPPGKIEMH